MVMIYLGKKDSNLYISYYFYNSQTNYIYVIYDYNNVSESKWYHCFESGVDMLSIEDYEYPFNELFLSNKLENELIPNVDGVDIYHRLEKIIDKIIFDNI